MDPFQGVSILELAPPPPEGFAAGLSVALFRKAGRVMSKVPEAKTA